MAGTAPNTAKRRTRDPRAVWKMQEAKAQFGLIARRALDEGPQRVTSRGKNAVVVLAADEYDRLVGKPVVRKKPGKEVSLVEFLRNSPLRDLDFEFPRDPMPVREPEF